MAVRDWWLVLVILITVGITALAQTTQSNLPDINTEESLKVISLAANTPQSYNLSVIDELHYDISPAPIIQRKLRIDVPIDSSEYTTITSDNYPLPYPDGAFDVEWTIGFGPGYGVEMIVRALDLNGVSNDYLIIHPGGMDVLTEDELVFAWFLKEERMYRLVHLDELTIKFLANQKVGNKNTGFKIDVKRIGELPTTTMPPTTEEAPVTVAPMEESNIYLKGLTPTAFLNISENFRKNLAFVAEKYCSENNITVDNITILENVNYHQIGSCFYNWPDSDTCVHIIYSIPVHFDNDSDTYELTSDHLADMWLRYHQYMNLSSLNLEVYPLPDDAHIVTVWVGISIGVILFFLLIIFLVWRYGFFYEYVSKSSMRDSLVSNKKDSVASFFPTPHQPVPPIFGMDSYADDKYWYDEDLPPRYSQENPSQFDSGEMGRQNLGFSRDGDLYDLYSDEEIIMSLPETHVKDQSTIRMSGGATDSNESNL